MQGSEPYPSSSTLPSLVWCTWRFGSPAVRRRECDTTLAKATGSPTFFLNWCVLSRAIFRSRTARSLLVTWLGGFFFDLGLLENQEPMIPLSSCSHRRNVRAYEQAQEKTAARQAWLQGERYFSGVLWHRSHNRARRGATKYAGALLPGSKCVQALGEMMECAGDDLMTHNPPAHRPQCTCLFPGR